MNRRSQFALELVAALAVAVCGAWVGHKLNAKDNRRAQAEERIAAALERAYPAPKSLPKPSLLEARDGWPSECFATAQISESGTVRPKECYPWAVANPEMAKALRGSKHLGYP